MLPVLLYLGVFFWFFITFGGGGGGGRKGKALGVKRRGRDYELLEEGGREEGTVPARL